MGVLSRRRAGEPVPHHDKSPEPVALKETVMLTAHPPGDPKTPNHTDLQTRTGT